MTDISEWTIVMAGGKTFVGKLDDYVTAMTLAAAELRRLRECLLQMQNAAIDVGTRLEAETARRESAEALLRETRGRLTFGSYFSRPIDEHFARYEPKKASP